MEKNNGATDDQYVGINLQIDGITYPLTILRVEEPYYRQAARLINEKLILYKQRFAMDGGERLMAMVALDITFHSFRDVEAYGGRQLSRKMGELVHLLDETIGREED